MLPTAGGVAIDVTAAALGAGLRLLKEDAGTACTVRLVRKFDGTDDWADDTGAEAGVTTGFQ